MDCKDTGAVSSFLFSRVGKVHFVPQNRLTCKSATKCYGTRKGPVSLIHGQFPRNECDKFLLVSSLVRTRARLAINKHLRTGEFVLSTDKNFVTDNMTM